MDQNQNLENSIQSIQQQKGMTDRRKIKMILKIVKHFAEYVKDTDNLPPDTLIPCCLFVLPTKFCEILKIQQNQPLDVEPQKKAIDVALQTYLKSMGKLLEKCDKQIKHVVIEGISKCILLTVPYPKISKKWLKDLINVWATQHMNINLGLRAFMAINKFLKEINEETLMWSLRRIYVSYFENCKQVSWRNLEHVNFMINCFCELAKVNESRTYYVLFGYIRSIALQMANLNKTKRKLKVELINKLYSNQILNCFRLLTAVVSRVNSEEMTSLIYPLIELTVSYEKITQANEFVPLKLHILTNLLTIMESTGVYIPPVIGVIQNLLKSKIFCKKLGKKAQKMGGDLELSFKLSPADLSNTSLINEVFEQIIHKVYWLISIVQKLSGGAQIIKKVSNLFKNLDYSFSGYKVQVSQITKLLKKDFYEHYKLRAQKHVSIVDKKGLDMVEKTLENNEFEITKKYQQMREQREQLLRKKLLAQNEQDGQKQEVQDEGAAEEQDEIDSGWQQAESGASSFHDQENEKRKKDFDDSESMDEQEQVSYEGDLELEEAEDAIKQWSEEEWQSQGEM